MGGAVSHNVTNSTLNAISNVATNVINNSITSAGQSVVINAEEVQGNFNYSGNTINQQIAVNTTALLSAMTDNNVQQQKKDGWIPSPFC